MLKTLKLRNFRSHADTQLEFGPFTLMLGAFGSGKSSILHALAAILCGRNAQTDLRGTGLRDEIMRGKSEFVLSCTMNGGPNSLLPLSVERSVNGEKHLLALNGNFQDVRRNQGALMQQLGVTEDLVLALLDPRLFLDRDETSQRKALLQFMSGGEIKVPPTARKIGINQIASVSHIDSLIKQLKEMRIRELNRENDRLEHSLPPAQDFDPAKLNDLKARLTKLRIDRETAIRQDEARKNYAAELERLQAKVLQVCAEAYPNIHPTRTSAESVSFAKKYVNSAIGEVGETVGTLTTKVENLREGYQKHQEGISDGQRQLDAARARAEKLEAQQATAGEMGEECGVINIFKCPLNTEDRRRGGAILQNGLELTKKEIKKLEKSLDALKKNQEWNQGEVEMAAKEVKLAETELATLKGKLAAIEAAEAEYQRHKESGARSQEPGADLKEIAEEIASAEIDKAVLEDAERLEATRLVQKRKIQANLAEVAELGRAVEELSQLKLDIMARQSGGFVETMRKFLKPFGLGEVELSTEPFGFVCNMASAKQLSGGERLIFDCAIRVAAAKASGFGVIAVDETTKLGEETRIQLATALSKAKLQCIMVSTTNKKPSPMRGIKILWFDKPLHGSTQVTVL